MLRAVVLILVEEARHSGKTEIYTRRKVSLSLFEAFVIDLMTVIFTI